MITGSVTMTEAVASCAYGGLNGSGPTKNDICAGTVREAVVEVSEIRHGPHLARRESLGGVGVAGCRAGLDSEHLFETIGATPVGPTKEPSGRPAHHPGRA